MKKLYILLVIAFIGFVGKAQIVNIPDANFKTRLLQADVTNQIARDVNFHFIKIDINGDGEIQSTEAEEVYSINVSYAFINDLTGINSFINLNYLDCSHNELTALNVSGLTNLISLVCLLNQLPTIDLTGLKNLSI